MARRDGHVRRPLLLALALAAWAAASAPEAVAGGDPTPPAPAVSQYVEMIPTSEGARTGGAAGTKATPLPSGVEKQLQEEGGRDAKVLEALATSPGYGATKKSGPGAVDRPAADAAGVLPSVAAEADDGRFLGLLAVLLVLTSAAAAVALTRRRRTTRSA